MMSHKTSHRIYIASLITKTIIGYRVLQIGSELNSATLVIASAFLMMGGMRYFVELVFNKIELYLVNKNDPECGFCKGENKINKERQMFATITFKVKNEKEFEDYKAASQLPDEEWELIG